MRATTAALGVLVSVGGTAAALKYPFADTRCVQACCHSRRMQKLSCESAN